MRSGFFNSEILGYDENNLPIFDRAESADFWAEYFKRFIGNGVYADPATSFQVKEYSGMTVKASPGSCFINGYFAFDPQDQSITLSQAHLSLSRIDRIVARLDLTQRTITLEKLTGSPSSSPSAPALTRNSSVYELGLADILIAPASNEVSQSDITDLRNDPNLCGIVAGVIDQIDTSDLFAQYQSAFEDWIDSVKDLISEEDVTALAQSLLDHTSNTSVHLSQSEKTLLANQNIMFSNIPQVMAAPLTALSSAFPSSFLVRNIAFSDSMIQNIPVGGILAIYE